MAREIKARKVTYEFQVLDQKTRKLLYSQEVEFTMKPSQERSTMFACQLVYQGEDMLKGMIDTRWVKKRKKR